MITVGLIKEINFISKFINGPVEFFLYISSEPIKVRVEDNYLFVFYKDNHIWLELIDGDLSFFGVESVDSISRIIACIDNNDPSWKDLYYYNQSQEKTS